MDIKKYISSGILEQYVLGLVSEKDRQEIEQYMLQYPEIKKEVNAIEQAMELYAEGSKMKASEGLEQSILKEIDNTPRELPNLNQASSSSSFSWLSYALAALLVGAMILCWWFYTGNQETQSQLAQQQSSYQELETDCNEKDEAIERLNNDIEVLINTATVFVPMKKEDNTLASVMYNAETKKAYLNVGSLPAAPADRTYELWALVDGVPISMGQFDIAAALDTNLIEVPFIENVGAYAVTLEPLDNDPAPNLDELQVISG